MAKKAKGEKKENPILIGILLLIVGAGMIAGSGNFVWVLFEVIELPLWIPGIASALLGVLSLVIAIKEKKNKKNNDQ